MNSRTEIKFIAALIVLSGLMLRAHAATYYVIVGSFSKEEPAREFAKALTPLFPDATSRFDGERSVYHVSVAQARQVSDAEHFLRKLRREKGFSHSWIYADFQAGEAELTSGDGGNSAVLELYTGASVLLGSTEPILSISRTKVRSDVDAAGLDITFTFSASNPGGLRLQGSVSLLKDGRPLSVFETGEMVALGGKHRTFTFLCQVPGYSPAIREIHVDALGSLPDVFVNSDGLWEIQFEVTRIKVDQIPLSYHNLFYENASVMRPEAKEAIDMLAAMLAANTDFRIVINSHCNPRTTRDISVPGTDPFDLASAESRSGSTKHLTKLRAEVLLDYLSANGLEAERVAVFGWGHLDPLVKGAEADLSKNDRIELELIR